MRARSGNVGLPIGAEDLPEAIRQGSVTVARRLKHQDGNTADAKRTIVGGAVGHGDARLCPRGVNQPQVRKVGSRRHSMRSE
jgi:hypothetical protein